MPAGSEKLRHFYHSGPWRDLSYTLRMSVGKCQRCGRVVTDPKHLHAHHKIELTDSNVDDPRLAFNPDNIEILCDVCHNAEHNRFGSRRQNAYIVYGPPCSGKTSYCLERMRRNDIIIDMDRIYESFTACEDGHEHSDALRFMAFRIRDLMYDMVKTRYGHFDNAYIVAGLPRKGEREALAKTLSAELIYIQTDMETCIKRAEASRPKRFIEIIKKYFDEFEE